MRKKGTKRAIRTDLHWLGLHELTHYVSASEKTLRAWIHSPVNPLPAARRNGKILVHRKVFDEWLRAHPIETSDHDKRIQAMVADSGKSTKEAAPATARAARKSVAKRAQARCTFDWAEGPHTGRLACVVHNHRKNDTVIASSATLKEMLTLGILTGQALKDAVSSSNRAIDENGTDTP